MTYTYQKPANYVSGGYGNGFGGGNGFPSEVNRSKQAQQREKGENKQCGMLERSIVVE